MSVRSNRKKVLIPLAVVSLGIGLFLAVSKRGAPVATPNAAPEIPTTTPPTTANQAAANFKDGTFTVPSDYVSPGGQDSIDVTLTLAGSVVTDASVTGHPSNPKSQEYQDGFTAAYKPLVVGKRLDQLQLDRVSGASLTTAAFNQAVAQVEAQTRL